MTSPNFIWIRPDMYEKNGMLDDQGAIDWAENIGGLDHQDALNFVKRAEIGDIVPAGDGDGFMMRVGKIWRAY